MFVLNRHKPYCIPWWVLELLVWLYLNLGKGFCLLAKQVIQFFTGPAKMFTSPAKMFTDPNTKKMNT